MELKELMVDKAKAIFIDKDGTLIHDLPYNVNPELIRYEIHALESMRILQDAGYLIVIITNQSGVGLNYFTREELKKIKEKIAEDFYKQNIRLDGFYYCPHLPDTHCNCRKPRPGLINQAARDMNIDQVQSWMIGDILDDVEAGNLSGSKTILLDNGNETEWILTDERRPDHIVIDLIEATRIILSKVKEYDAEATI